MPRGAQWATQRKCVRLQLRRVQLPVATAPPAPAVRPSAGVQTRIRRSCTAASSEGAAAAAAAGGPGAAPATAGSPGAAPAKKKKSVAWVEGTSDALTC